MYIKSDKHGDFTVCFDTEDYDIVSKYHWGITKARSNKCDYAKCYVMSGGTILHRLITNCPKGMVVDHINGDSMDNRKSNLRICSIRENCMNSKLDRNNVSGYTGVFYLEGNYINRWRANIRVNRKLLSLGHFYTKEEAIAVRKEAEEKYFGEFARQNISTE